MGFLGNPIKAIGKGLSKLPGAKTLNKPINKALSKTPGLKSVPGKLGMAGPAKTRDAAKAPVGGSPIAPSVGAASDMMQNKASQGMAPGGGMSVGAGIARPPMPMQRQPPPPPQTPMPPSGFMPPSEGMPQLEMAPPQQQEMMPPPMMPPPGGQGQIDPNMLASLKQKMMGGNTGVTGGMMNKGGIGPRWGGNLFGG